MMTRHGLVQRQRRKDVKRTAFERIRIHPIGTRTFAVERGADVATRRIFWRDVLWNRLDPVRLTRQRLEQRWQLTVHLLGDGSCSGEKLLRGIGVELWIGTQEIQELGEIPPEAGLGDDLIHLRPDASDLIEADLMNFVGGDVESRVVSDQVVVVLASAR